MLPNNDINTDDIEIIKDPSLSYKLDLDKERVRKCVDDIESIKQAIYKILNTERYTYTAYNWQYGIELNDLIGQPKSLVKAILPDRIKEALMVDDRIQDVVDFKFEDISKTEIDITFIVKAYEFEQIILIKWGWKI